MTPGALAVVALLAAAPKYVVVIGHNASDRPQRGALRYADDDAARFYELLSVGSTESYLFTSFDTESQELFDALRPVARVPRKDDVMAAFANVRAGIEANRDAEVYFFYAGHGDIEDGVGYLTLADGRLTRDDFSDALLKAGAARTHVIVDACKSYFFVAGRGRGGRRVPQTTPFAGPERLPGVGYVLSTSSDADSHEWSAFNGGIFSHEVRSGLVGGADANHDGTVDYEELGAFVALANASVPSPAFRPDVYVRAPPDEDDATIFSPADLTSTLTVELAMTDTGRVMVHDQRGLRYADANKAGEAPLRITLLQPWRYEVRVGGRHYDVDPGQGEVRLAELTPSTEMLAARGEAHRAFEHLFATAFSEDVVLGYGLRPPDPGEVRIIEKEKIVERITATPPPPSNPWPAALTGGGAALLASGVIVAGLAVSARSELAEASQQDLASIDARADALEVGAGVLFGVGASAAITGVVWWLLE